MLCELCKFRQCEMLQCETFLSSTKRFAIQYSRCNFADPLHIALGEVDFVGLPSDLGAMRIILLYGGAEQLRKQ